LLAALLARCLGRSWVAAFVAGLLYGFSPYVFGQALGHANLTLIAFPPFVGIVLVRLLRGRWSPRRAGVLLGVGGALQLLASEEILASSVLAFVVLLLVAWGVAGRERLRQVWPQLGTAALVAVPVGLVVGAVPLAVQFFGPQQVHGQLNSRTDNVADLLNYVLPVRTQALAPSAVTAVSDRFTGNIAEWGAYLGLPLLAVVVWYVWRRWQDGAVRLPALFAGAMAVLSLGPLVHAAGHQLPVPTPMAVVAVLPLFSNMLAARLVVYVLLGVALLLARFVDDAALMPSAAWRGPLVVLALGVLMPALPVVTSRVDVPRFFAEEVSRVPAGAVALVAPYPGPQDARAMAWQARADMRFAMVGGYIAVDGPGGRPTASGDPTVSGRVLTALEAGFPVQLVPAALTDAARTELHRLHVSTVLLGPMPNLDAADAWLSTLLGRPPQVVDGVAVWAGVG
jgi:hypothetical protein